ncbi:hypothetical protein Acsp03_68410 [Actinomadura sp. NBRC 104412]|nr:hypothetical protein Acsp03_68410 [Actinomadura sp. NBRC 104412]
MTLTALLDEDLPARATRLTSGAAHAVRQMRGPRRETSVATQSALAMVMAGLRQIATDSVPDPAVRRQAIDEQIAALRGARRWQARRGERGPADRPGGGGG